MRKKLFKQIFSFLLCVVLTISLVPGAVVAADTSGGNGSFVSETHDVFQHTESTLAPGVEQYTNYAYAKDGKQMVYYVATADISRDDVVVQTSYLKQHENGVMGMDKLTNQIAYANQKYSDPSDPQYISEHYNVVAGVNASFYNMTTGQPMGITYIDGVSFGTSSYDNFFAILKDGKTAVIDYAKNIGNYVDADGNSTIWQAVAGSQWLVRDGKDVTADISGSYNTQRHSRTCVGVTAEGKVVMMVLDGRQEPFSCGGTMHELAQIMLEAGCVAAVNLDGGGSTTFAARQEGTDQVRVINRPSDGSERSISSGLMIASTAVPSNTFDHVTMQAEDTYVTPGTATNVAISGVSPAGTSAEIPSDITYQVSNGTYADGVLTAGTAGDVTLTAVYQGSSVGSLTIHAVLPEKLAFDSDEMTAPFGQTITLGLSATYGLNQVKLKAEDLTFSLANAAIGTIQGLDFTAGDGSVTESAITATVNGTDVQATSKIKLGKGSEVVFDFEDGDTSMFELSYPKYNYVLPEGKVYPVTAETGKVHSGNGAMALDINYGNSLESGYMMTALHYKGEEKKYENATKLGMWIYISDEDVSAWIRYVVYPLVLNDAGEYVRASSSLTNTLSDGVASTAGFVNQYQEPGWHYLSIDLSGYKGLDLIDYYMVQFYISDRDGAAYDYYYNQHKSYNGRYVMYVDDITVDYSDAVADREAPIFGDVTYATGSMSDAVALNGQTVADSTISFGAKVADNMEKNNYTGLDSATAKAYIDGVETACTFKDGVFSVVDAVLADGLHHVKFSICDNQGNYASVIRTINVQANSGKSTVKVVAHDPSLDKIKLGSVWYADIVATDIEKVQSVTVDIDLNNMSRWELEHMTVAPGFEATYSIQDDENIAAITITRTGSNADTGEGVLASLPIRTWELKTGYTYESGTKNGQPAFTYKQFRDMKEFWPVDISMEIDRGLVTFVDGTTDTFSGEGPHVDTEMYKMAKDMISTAEGKAYYDAWDGGHIHTAAALPDQAATCTEDGYTGRTYCESCNSVVDWGTTIPAAGHSYGFVDGVLQCTVCAAAFDGVYTDGKLYADGVPLTGWKDDSYYRSGEKLTGIQKVAAPDGSGDFYYDFGTDGICAERVKYTGFIRDDIGLRYAKIGTLSSGWLDVDGDYYYFDAETYYAISDGRHGVDGVPYDFRDYKLYNGYWVQSKQDGHLEFYWAGRKLCNTWFTLRGKTYHFDMNCRAATGTMLVKLSTGGSSQMYVFDDAGVLQYPVTSTGIYRVGDTAYYLVDGIAKIGLWEENGRYYYFNSAYVMTTGGRYVDANAAHGIVEPGYYSFGDDGAMFDREFAEVNGTVKYFVMGKPYYAGAVKIGGNIYYADQDGVMATGVHYVDKTNGLIQAGTYLFGEDGVLVGPGDASVVASGSCGENATWTLYDSGKLEIGGTGAVSDYESQLVTPWVGYRDQIKSIEIGAGITSIGRYAFSHLYECTSITFAEGSKLEKIEVTGFYYDFQVTSVVLPETVRSIGVLAFGNMYGLTDLYVPQGVSMIGDNAFRGSRQVTLSVAAGTYSETYAAANQIAYTTRAYVPVVVASGSCGENATWTLYDSGKLEIGGTGAVSDYESQLVTPWVGYRDQIKSIEIGAGITSIGRYAFSHLYECTSITFAEGSKLEKIEVTGFYYDFQVTSVVLPETVRSIGVLAFGNMYGLTDLYVPQGVSMIGDNAFRGSRQVTLSVAAGSYAELYAVNQNIAHISRDK